MTSRVTVYATPEEMEKLFDDTQGRFSIRYYEQTERMGPQAKFELTVRHGDKRATARMFHKELTNLRRYGDKRERYRNALGR